MIHQHHYRAWVVLALILISGFITQASATIFNEAGEELNDQTLFALTNGTLPSDVNRTVVYFYDPECESCFKVGEFLDTYLKDHPDTDIERISIAEGPVVFERFNQYKKDYNRESVFIPVMYFGPVALEGATDITRNFETVYNWLKS